MTDKLEYKNYINCLFDIYGSLLTVKQQEYFKMYYFEDLSLREIASVMNVSSNAVYDQIKTIEKVLEKYEDNLHIYLDSEKKNEVIEKLEEELKSKNISDDSINKLLEELKK